MTAENLIPLWGSSADTSSPDDKPDGVELLREADAAHDARDWPLAIELWARLRALDPDQLPAYELAVEALIASGRTTEADSVASAGMARFPGNPSLQIGYALAAHRGRRWAEAASRWQTLRHTLPRDPIGYINGAAALMSVGNFVDAEKLLLEGKELFPESFDVAVSLAWVANRFKRWRDAEAQWRRLYEERPDNDQVCTGLADALYALRRFDEARPIIAVARKKRPNDPFNTVVEARIAIAQGRSAEAVASLTAARLRHPNDNGIRAVLNDATMRAMLENFDDTVAMSAALSTPAPVAVDRTTRLRDMFSGFESLGSTCEFGLVQRFFGAEPLGLLRWSNLTLEQLVDALQRDFEGVGQPENTTLMIRHAEWYTQDIHFGMAMHTFILANEEPEEVIFPKLCKRLQFLSRKLLEDMEDGEKFFVYKSELRVTDDEALQLFSEIRKRGPSPLLVVMLAEGDEKPGTVREVADGLMIGYITKFFDPKPEIDPWLRVATKAHAIWSARADYLEP